MSATAVQVSPQSRRAAKLISRGVGLFMREQIPWDGALVVVGKYDAGGRVVIEIQPVQRDGGPNLKV